MSAKYNLYLRSDCWMKTIRVAAMQRAGGICQARIRCDGAPAVHTHHNSYACVGVERPQDLLAVCAACHRALHNIAEPANDNSIGPTLLDWVSSVPLVKRKTS